MNLLNHLGSDNRIWYATYGSNIPVSGIQRYLPELNPAAGEEAWLTTKHQRYFAANSGRWQNGGIAFLSLNEPEVPASTTLKAYLVTPEQFARVTLAENGMGWSAGGRRLEFDWDIPVGSNSEPQLETNIKMRPGATFFRSLAIYNAMVRLNDIDGRPAYTITTNQKFNFSTPSKEYMDVIWGGLAENPTGAEERPSAFATGDNLHLLGEELADLYRWDESMYKYNDYGDYKGDTKVLDFQQARERLWDW